MGNIVLIVCIYNSQKNIKQSKKFKCKRIKTPMLNKYMAWHILLYIAIMQRVEDFFLHLMCKLLCYEICFSADDWSSAKYNDDCCIELL